MTIDILRSREDSQDAIDVVIEIPRGSNIKYEMGIETGILFIDRKLSVTMIYPCNYGFVSKTREEMETTWRYLCLEIILSYQYLLLDHGL